MLMLVYGVFSKKTVTAKPWKDLQETLEIDLKQNTWFVNTGNVDLRQCSVEETTGFCIGMDTLRPLLVFKQAELFNLHPFNFTALVKISYGLRPVLDKDMIRSVCKSNYLYLDKGLYCAGREYLYFMKEDFSRNLLTVDSIALLRMIFVS